MKKNKLTLIRNNILYLFIAIFAFYLIFDLIAPDKTVSVFGFKIYTVSSPSMEPTLMVDDAVLVVRTDVDKLVENKDIITFKAYIPELGEEDVVTHYFAGVIDTDDTLSYKTRGETSEIDEWKDSEGNPVDIKREDIIGKVSFKLPYLGELIKILRDPIMVILIVINIGIIIYTVKLIKSRRKTA
ncbi:MAG: signal peptidase I [Candidatus Izemoplasmatales bacterium]|jgi:signal peptidase